MNPTRTTVGATLILELLLIGLNTAQAAPAQLVPYVVATDSPALEGQFIVESQNWRCHKGTCRSDGPQSVPNPKVCVALSRQLKVKITAMTQGSLNMDATGLKLCRAFVATSGSNISRGQQEHLTAAPGARVYPVNGVVGTTATNNGGLRLVAPSGNLLLIQPNGKVFVYNTQRKLTERGQFVVWQSADPTYRSTQPVFDAMRSRCNSPPPLPRAPGLTVGGGFLTPQCKASYTWLALVYQPTKTMDLDGETAARKDAFFTDYSKVLFEPTTRAKTLRPKSTEQAQVTLGPVTASKPYDDSMYKTITIATDGVRSCYTWFLGRVPNFAGQGQLVLSYGSAGAFDSAVVMSSSYPNGPLLNACIEKQLNDAKYPTMATSHTVVGIPFALGLEAGVDSLPVQTKSEHFDVAKSAIGWRMILGEAATKEQRGSLSLPDGRGVYFTCRNTKCETTSCQYSLADRTAMLEQVLAEQHRAVSTGRLGRESNAFAASPGQARVLEADSDSTGLALKRLAERAQQRCTAGAPMTLDELQKLETEVTSTRGANQLPVVVDNWLDDTRQTLERAAMLRPLPHETDTSPSEKVLSENDGVYAYAVTMSFHGFEGVIVLDDDEAFSVKDVNPTKPLQVRQFKLEQDARSKLAQTYNGNRFFRFPAHLRNSDVKDGSEIALFAASSRKSHTSSNYMHTSTSFRTVYSEFTKAAPLDAGAELDFSELERALNDYLQRLDDQDERRNAIGAWLKQVNETCQPASPQRKN